MTSLRLILACPVDFGAKTRPDADAHFAGFLALFAETDYARSAVLERRSFAPALERFIDGVAGSPLRGAAQSLLSAMRRADADRIFMLRTREQEILWRLDGQGDKAIAAELGITIYGVRVPQRSRWLSR